MPKVSIIITAYNVESYIEQSVRSALSQTTCDVEVIVINDGSTDNTKIILDTLSLENNRLIVISQENKGPSVARNIGLDLCRGTYVLFLDGDDYIDRRTIEKCIEASSSEETDIIFFSATSFYDGGSALIKDGFYTRTKDLKPKSSADVFINSNSCSKYIVSACLYMVKRASIGNLRFFPGIYHEDNLFTTELLLKKNLKCVTLDDELYFRRIRKNSITTTKTKPQHVEGYLIVAEQLINKYKFSGPLGNNLADHIIKILCTAMIISTNLDDNKKYKEYLIRARKNFYLIGIHRANIKQLLRIIFPKISKFLKS